MAEHYDLVVIGCGPAGEKGAAQAAYFGKRVAIVERAEHVGGVGVNTGTIPSKTLRETALYFSGLQQRGLYGIDYCLREGITIQDFLYRKQAVIANERRIVQHNLDRHGITVIHGEAVLQDSHTVLVRRAGDEPLELHAATMLIATGSSPFRPDYIPFDDDLFYDSDSIINMTHMPRNMTVLGGGVIGCEYAALFAALGLAVTLISSGSRLLPFIDGEIAERLQGYLETLGVRFLFQNRVVSAKRSGDQALLHLETGESVSADVALVAAGRTGNVEGLGLAALGVQVHDRGIIQVNERYQTSVPNIYAAGDVVGFPALASTAMEQARVAMVHAFDFGYKEQLSTVVPLAVYTIPEISMVGLTEQACREQGIPYLLGRSSYETNPRGQIIGDLSGMMKLIFSPDDKKLLGVHLIGELASELIHIGAQVMAYNGSIDAFIAAVYNYPTLSDTYKYAAYDGLGNLQRWQDGNTTKSR